MLWSTHPCISYSDGRDKYAFGFELADLNRLLEPLREPGKPGQFTLLQFQKSEKKILLLPIGLS